MTSNDKNGIQEDMVAEAVRVAEKAEAEDVALRLLGGVAIKVRATDGLQPVFEREYADLDWITQKGKSSRVQKFFESLGYVPQTRFNTMYGRERLLYFDEEHDRQVDVLVGSLVSLLEPVMVIMLGGICGFIVIALFMPMVTIITAMST